MEQTRKATHADKPIRLADVILLDLTTYTILTIQTPFMVKQIIKQDEIIKNNNNNNNTTGYQRCISACPQEFLVFVGPFPNSPSLAICTYDYPQPNDTASLKIGVDSGNCTEYILDTTSGFLSFFPFLSYSFSFFLRFSMHFNQFYQSQEDVFLAYPLLSTPQLQRNSISKVSSPRS